MNRRAYADNYAAITWTPLPELPRRVSDAARAPAVIRDTMDPLRHHGTGKITDSKSRFRQMTRDSGCVEIGNERPPLRVPTKPAGNLKDDMRKAIWQLRNGRDVRNG